MTCFAPSPRPSTSIWGAVQQADQLGPGIWSVMTACHGGIILSSKQAAFAIAYGLDIMVIVYDQSQHMTIGVKGAS